MPKRTCARLSTHTRTRTAAAAAAAAAARDGGGRYREPERREGRLCVLMELCDGGCVAALLRNYGALRWNIVARSPLLATRCDCVRRRCVRVDCAVYFAHPVLRMRRV